MDTGTTYSKFKSSFGNLFIDYTGERYPPDEPKDTKVEINGEVVCWISWEDREEFAAKLESIVTHYRI